MGGAKFCQCLFCRRHLTADDLVADKVGHLPAISEIKDAAGNRHREPAHLPMPPGKVRHVGDIVAMIAADVWR